jgi:ribosome assembly protein YihI (activator of Der GTPase)
LISSTCDKKTRSAAATRTIMPRLDVKKPAPVAVNGKVQTAKMGNTPSQCQDVAQSSRT